MLPPPNCRLFLPRPALHGVQRRLGGLSATIGAANVQSHQAFPQQEGLPSAAGKVVCAWIGKLAVLGLLQPTSPCSSYCMISLVLSAVQLRATTLLTGICIMHLASCLHDAASTQPRRALLPADLPMRWRLRGGRLRPGHHLLPRFPVHPVCRLQVGVPWQALQAGPTLSLLKTALGGGRTVLAAAAACQELIPRPPPSLLQRKRQGHCEVSISSGSA